MRVLIVDNSALLREGLALIPGDDGREVTTAVGSGAELVPCVLELRPELIIAGIHMPPSSTDEGLRTTVEIRSHWGEAPILLLSQYVVAAYVQELLADDGIHPGYLLKDRVTDIDTFLEATDHVAGSGLVLDPKTVAQVLGHGRKAGPVTQLSLREREALELMAEGHTNADITKRLVVAEGAIEKRIQRVLSKLGLHPDPGIHRRVEAVLILLPSWSPPAGVRELKKLEVRSQRSPASP